MTGNRRGGRLAAAVPLAWVRHKFPRQVAWGGRRLDPRTPLGFWLTFTVSVGVLAALAFGGITQDVVGHHEATLLDLHVTAWAVAHRIDWLTIVIRVATWLGSTAVIVPLAVIVGVFFMLCRHRWWPIAFLAAAIGGAVGLYDIVKSLVGRPRPPSAIWIGHFSGAAFPSGHATQSVACYSALAIILGAGRPPAVKTVLWSVAGLVVLVVGASRIYLGAHWLTDVLGGYALGASWVAVITTVALVTWPDALVRSGSGGCSPAGADGPRRCAAPRRRGTSGPDL